MTMAPGLIQLPRTISGRPTAATTRSARRTTLGQIARARVGDRHRAVLGQQQLRHRLADDVGAADHHRLEPREVAAHGLGQDHAARSACRAPAPRRADASRPTLMGWKPSTSLAGSIASITCARRCARAAAAAPGCRARPAPVELADQRQQRRLGACRPAACARATACRPRASPSPWCARRPGSPDPRRPARRPAPASMPRSRFSAATPARNLAAQRLGDRLAVDDRRTDMGVPCAPSLRARQRAAAALPAPPARRRLHRLDARLAPAVTATLPLGTPSHCGHHHLHRPVRLALLGHGAHPHLQRRPLRASRSCRRRRRAPTWG